MGEDATKCFLRRNSKRRWIAGRFINCKPEPTKEERIAFLTGFNMGWKCNKTKRILPIPETQLLKPKEG